MATVQRRKQGNCPVVYRVRWWAGGKQRSKTFKTAQEAKRFKAVLEGDYANGTFVDPKNSQVTVADFATEWFNNVVDLRPSTKARLRTVVWQHVIPEFGTLPLAGVTNEQVAQWVGSSKHSASTTRKNLFALRRLLQAAVDQGRLKTNVAVSVRPPAEPRNEQRFLDQMEVKRLHMAMEPRLQALVSVAVYGGLRFGELGALRRKDVDLGRGTVKVRETLIDIDNEVSFGPPKTKSSLRTVTLPRSIANELAQHMQNYVGEDPNALLFTGKTGSPLRRAWFRRLYWQPALEAAELDTLRFHDLRHTFVALWVSLGRNAKEVSKVAGHSSVAFTLDRYGHLYDTDDEGLGDALDALLGA